MGLDLSMLRHPGKIPKSFPKEVRETPGYFRGGFLVTMDVAGIFDYDTEFLKGPDWPPPGIKEERAEQLRLLFEPAADDDPVISLIDLKPTYRELRLMQKYFTESDRTNSARSKKQGRVPVFKFGSNDGWIVTPEECLIIAIRLRLYLAEESHVEDEGDPEGLEAFIAFNELAAKYGGYRVC